MSQVTIDMSNLTEDQLAVMSTIDPQAVREERARRNAYDSLEQGFTDLAQAAFDLAEVVNNIKQTAATRAVKETGILPIVDRLLATARLQNIDYSKPQLKENK